MFKKIKSLLIAIIVTAIVVGVGEYIILTRTSANYEKRYNESKNELDKLIQDQQRFKSTFDDMSSDYNELKHTVNDIRKENIRLTEQITNIKRGSDQSGRIIDDSQNELGKLEFILNNSNK